MLSKKCVSVFLVSIFLFADAAYSGPLDDIRNGLQILNQLDQLTTRHRRNQGSNQPQRRSSGTTRQEWANIQARLNELGFNAGKVDGRPGSNTKNAIAAFQSANGLAADGKIGTETRELLFSSNARGVEYLQADSSGGNVVGQKNTVKSGGSVPSWANAIPAEASVGEPTDDDEALSVAAINVEPSIDCSDPSVTEVELTICNSPDLLNLQNQVDERYQSALASSDNSEVQTSQEQWIKMRAGCGGNAACIEGAMNMRLAVLPEVEKVESPKKEEQATAQSAAPSALLGKILPHESEIGTIIGHWEGTAKCAEGYTYFMTLALQSAGGIRYTAQTGYAWATLLSDEFYKETYIGEDIGGSNFEFIFQGVSGGRGMGRHRPRDFSFAFDPQKDVLKGTYKNEECISFELTRTSEESMSRVYLVDADISHPTYWQVSTLAEKCGFFRDYFELPFAEFSAKKRNDVMRDGSAFVLLADRHFAPRFGNIVDALSPVRKKQVVSDYNQCQQDPIWKARLAPYVNNVGGTVLFWGFQDGLQRYEKPKPPFGSDLNFWKMRQGRNEVYLAVRKAEALNDAEASKKQISSASDKIRNFERLFFPSEIAELKARLAAVEAKSFELIAGQKFAKIDSIEGNGEKLAALSKLYDGRHDAMRGAAAEVKADYEAAIVKQQLDVVLDVLEPALAANLEDGKEPSTAITEFEMSAKALDGVSASLLPDTKSRASALLADKRTALLDEAMSVERTRLSNFDASASGVEANLAWAKKFQETYGQYNDFPAVASLSSEFGELRNTLLQAAFPKFQADVEEALATEGLAGARRVATAYLGWQGDADLAASRDYMSVLASAELEGLQAIPSDMNKIVQSKVAYDGRSTYQKSLPAEKFQVFETKILAKHEEAARSLLDRAVKVDQISSVEDVTVVDSKLAKADALFARMIPTVAEKLKNEISSKSAAAIQGFVSEEFIRLDSFASDSDGLSASAEWIRAFNQKFEPFKEKFDFATAQKRFSARRGKLLGDALGVFETELAEVSESEGADGIDRLLGKYLSWKGDQDLPVALEYEFIAETYK